MQRADFSYLLLLFQNKYKISTMASSKEENVILSKISTIVKKIQDFLIEVGYSSKQIAAYFCRKVFSSKANMI